MAKDRLLLHKSCAQFWVILYIKIIRKLANVPKR